MNIVLCDVCFHYDLLKAFSCSRNYLITTSTYLYVILNLLYYIDIIVIIKGGSLQQKKMKNRKNFFLVLEASSVA
jgi:hypothetical protein